VKNERKTLKNSSILLGVTGSIGAYKTPDLVRRLREEGASVTVIMTEAAQYFVTPMALEIASQNKVYMDLFSTPMAHINLPEKADTMLIAPATADMVGKMALGIADDLLSTCLLSFHGHVAIAPAMNWRMYQHPAFQANLNTLRSRGVLVIGPEKGPLACGEEGVGRMSDAADIVQAVNFLLTDKDLVNERILVTAGPTREYLDPVRFLSNRSSGKMGYAVARAARSRGAHVTLISGHSALPRPWGIDFIPVDTADEMYRAVGKEISSSTVLIMSAAVADYMPAKKSPGKTVKTKGLTLHLTHTPDILSFAARKKKRLFIIGFSAETGPRIKRARIKLKTKKMDMIIFNDVTEPGSGFDTDTNRITIIDTQGEISTSLMTKDSAAHAILDRMLEITT
jgi:phosphopantothenoylcysteine decarboxylase/phosphopantothenate--cysteine ligase